MDFASYEKQLREPYINNPIDISVDFKNHSSESFTFTNLKRTS